MDYYYLDSARKTMGPVPEQVLLGMHRIGHVKDDTMVVQVGKDQWLPLCQALGVSPKGGNTPHAAANLETASNNKALPIILISAAVVVVIAGGVWALGSSRPSAPAAKMEGSKIEIAEMPDPVEARPSEPTKARAPVEKVELAKAPPAGLPPLPATAPVSTQAAEVPVKATDHPMGEWYDLGHHLGIEAQRAYQEFGVTVAVQRTHMTQMIKNLGVEIETLPGEEMIICYQGYQDGFAGRSPIYKVPNKQTESTLPPELRGYSNFPNSEASKRPKLGTNQLEKAIECVAVIMTRDAESIGHGSGFFIAPGILVTNRHVIEGAQWIKVRTSDGSIHDGTLLAKHSNLDIAVVSISARNYPILKLGRADQVHVGDDITAIGFPSQSNLSATVTFGRISSVERSYKGNDLFQLDLSINHGNSGGPLVNARYEVIGINTFGFAADGLDRFNFAIKISQAMPLIKQAYPEFTGGR